MFISLLVQWLQTRAGRAARNEAADNEANPMRSPPRQRAGVENRSRPHRACSLENKVHEVITQR